MKFLEAKQLEANRRFLNANGKAFYAQGEKSLYAEGTTKTLSQPIIIIAENTGTENSAEVELFDAQSVLEGQEAYTITGGGSVVKTSGVPNVPLRKIYGDMVGGNVYTFNKLRIECMEAELDAIKESSCGASLCYKLTTSTGDVTSRPIYPLISVVQQVKSVRDIELGDLLFNQDTSFVVESIPASTKMKYMFYATEQGSATAQLLRGDTAKGYDEVSLNTIDL